MPDNMPPSAGDAPARGEDARGEDAAPRTVRPGESRASYRVASAATVRHATPEEVADMKAALAPPPEDDGEIIAAGTLAAAGSFAKHLLGLLALAVTGLTGYIVTAELGAMMRALRDMPPYAAGAGYFFLGLFLLAMLVPAVSFARFYFSLRVNRPVSLVKVARMAQVPGQRSEAYQRARTVLTAYLENYPLAGADGGRDGASPFTAEERAELERKRKYLLTDMARADAESWVASFREGFLQSLDRKAAERIRKTVARVGLATAACPFRFGDFIISFTFGFDAFMRLTRIYNQRLGYVEAMYVFVAVLLQSLTSYGAQEATESVFEAVWNEVAAGVNAAFKGVGQRVAEGAINAYFCHRVSTRAQTFLRPITE